MFCYKVNVYDGYYVKILLTMIIFLVLLQTDRTTKNEWQ